MSTDDPITPLDRHQARTAVTGALHEIVPDADVATLGDDVPFRDELELDSLDFLSFVELLSAACDVRIDEDDYRRASTIRGCIDLLTGT